MFIQLFVYLCKTIRKYTCLNTYISFIVLIISSSSRSCISVTIVMIIISVIIIIIIACGQLAPCRVASRTPAHGSRPHRLYIYIYIYIYIYTHRGGGNILCDFWRVDFWCVIFCPFNSPASRRVQDKRGFIEVP